MHMKTFAPFLNISFLFLAAALGGCGGSGGGADFIGSSPGKAYGVSYDTTDGAGKGTEPAAEWALKLTSSADGTKYELITKLDVPGRPNETTLRFLPDDTMIALVRREAGDKAGWIGRSRPPYRDWEWSQTKSRLGGPNFIRLPDGSLWAAGFANRIPSGALLLVSDQPMIPEGVKTEASDAKVSAEYVERHISIGIEALKLIRRHGKSVRHLRFDE